jgi:site-specific recombinase XerD
VRRFVRFHGTRQPAELSEPDVTPFLSWLAEDGRGSAPTQTQAASALVFLYREVLDRPLGRFEQLVRAKQPHRLPVVLTHEEVAAVIAGAYRTAAARVRSALWQRASADGGAPASGERRRLRGG